MIDQAFWSDPEVEAQKAGIKLAALWLITNSQTSQIGICTATPARFSFETGLPAAALTGAVEALPGSFIRVGSAIFIKNYIRHQYGIGEKLTKNNFFISLKALFLAVKDQQLADSILDEYPEFLSAVPDGRIPKEQRDHVVAPGLRAQILERDEFVCVLTGVKLPPSELEIDHVLAASKGGRTEPENLVAMSKALNTKKNKKDLRDFCLEEGIDFELVSERLIARASKPLLGLPKPKVREGKEGGGGEARPQTREEAQTYGAEIGMTAEQTDAWFDHFQSNGWRVSGKTPMKDWKAAMRNGKRMAVKFEPVANGNRTGEMRPLPNVE